MTDRIDEIVRDVMGWHPHEAPPLKWKDWRALVAAGIEAAATQDEAEARLCAGRAAGYRYRQEQVLEFDEVRKGEMLEASAARHRSLLPPAEGGENA